MPVRRCLTPYGPIGILAYARCGPCHPRRCNANGWVSASPLWTSHVPSPMSSTTRRMPAGVQTLSSGAASLARPGRAFASGFWPLDSQHAACGEALHRVPLLTTVPWHSIDQYGRRSFKGTSEGAEIGPAGLHGMAHVQSCGILS